MVFRMKRGGGYDWKEYGFLMLLAVLCAVVAILQYRWTGELAKAEFERLGGAQRESAQRLVETFDRELAESVQALTPLAREMKPASIAVKVRRWQEGKPQPLFRRMGLAIPGDAGVSLNLIDPVTGKMTAAPWPEEWGELQGNLAGKADGTNRAPYMGGSGLLFEWPIRSGAVRPPPRSAGAGGPGERGGPPPDGPGGGPGGPPMEAGWMIFELDEAFARRWLGELAGRYINPAEQDYYRVTVTSFDQELVLLAPGDAEKGGEKLDKPVSTGFNRQGRPEMGSRGGPPVDGRWILTTQRRTGELEAIVASSRMRNLMLAFAVNGLILAAGVALVRHTHRSRRLARAQMDFVANVSHELRTPVTVILGAAHNLKRGIVSSPEAVERYAGMIQRHGQQLSDMVQEVLEFSAARKGGTAYRKVPLEVAELLRAAVDDTKEDTSACEVELTVPEDLPKVEGEPGALRRVFMNLIGNAAKHGGGGWIGISARRAGRQVEITVSDRGPGVPRAEQGRIFEPFYRGSDACGKQTRGSGLGLGLVKEIAEAHGGRVSVSSEPGEGATFIVSLPACGAAS